MKKEKKKDRHLLAELGVLIAVLFCVAIIVNALLIVYYQAKSGISFINKYQKYQAQYLADNLCTYACTSWFLEYCCSHPDLMPENYSGSQKEIDDVNTFQRHLDYHVDIWAITDEEAEKMSAADQKRLARMIYSYVLDAIGLMNEIGDDSFLSVSVPVEGDNECFVFYSKDGSGERESYCIGKELELDHSKNSLPQYYFGGEKGDKPSTDYNAEASPTGRPFLSTFVPIRKDGKVIGLVRSSMEISFKRILPAIGSIELANYLVLVVIGFVLLLLIRRTVVRPISVLQNQVRTYKEDKDSTSIVNALEKITSRNEIGRLSEDMSDLAMEMNQYAGELVAITAERERVDAELNVARRIQYGVLPKDFPENDSYTIYASMDPAWEVGGDFYDFFFPDEEHVGLVIADVSGKGVPAAFFMVEAKLLIKNAMMSGEISPAKVLEKANRALCEGNDELLFVTVWIGVLELSTGRLTCANAGHEYPFLLRDGGSFELCENEHGIPLGLAEDMEFEEYELSLGSKDAVFVYTDGVPEAQNEAGEQFSEEEMSRVLNESPGDSPRELIDRMKDRVGDFCGKADPFDDITMLCVKMG